MQEHQRWPLPEGLAEYSASRRAAGEDPRHIPVELGAAILTFVGSGLLACEKDRARPRRALVAVI